MKRIVLAIVALGLGTQLSNAQIRTYTSNDEDSISCVQNLSLYIEFYKQKNYADAVKGWRKAAVTCPKSTESLWQNGISIFQNLAKAEKDAAAKDLLLDTLFWAYDQRIEHFGKEGYVLGRKGSDMAKYRKKDPKAANEVLMRSLELQGMKMEAGAMIYLYKTSLDLFKKGEIEKIALFDLYGRLAEISAHNINAAKSDAHVNAYTKAQENVDKMFVQVADCASLVEVFQPKYEATPDDAELLKRILKFMDKQDCTSEDLYQQAAVSLDKIEPSAESGYAIANGYAKKKQYGEALDYYTKAAERTDDNELKMKAYSKGAAVALASGRYSTAKSYALKMLSINPNSGDAYIMIGDAYAKGRKGCGDNECTKRAAYWAAVDKYAKAKSVDPSVADQAQSRINTYTAQFPKKEDCFFHGINDGDPYTLDCWIGETTTVRTRQ